MLSPEDIKKMLDPVIQTRTEAASLDATLKENIRHHLEHGELVLCLTAGGGNSLDEWLRKEFK